MNQWLQTHGPGLVHQWCTQHAEPLLLGYLEQWMTINATQLLTQVSGRQSHATHAASFTQAQQLQQMQQQLATMQQVLYQHGLAVPPGPSGGGHGKSPTPNLGFGSYSPPPSHGSLAMLRRTTSPLAISQLGQVQQQRAGSTSPMALGEDASPGSSSGTGAGAYPDVRQIMRNRLNSQAAAAVAAAAAAANSYPSAPSSSPPPPPSAMLSPITVHRPLGLGFGRASPEYYSGHGLGVFPHMKGPIAEVLSSGGDTSTGPGEEVSREASPLAYGSPLNLARELSTGAMSLGSQPHPHPRRLSISSSASSLGLSNYEKPQPNGFGSTGVSSGHVDILVVEDVRVAQKLAHAALTRAHFRVDIACSGEVALDKVRVMLPLGCPKVILMDITLPGMSGVEATERIRKMENDWHASVAASGNPAQQRQTWIYGLTGNVEPDDLMRYRAAGMNGCILKGRLLADSVRAAVEESERHPHSFVNLAEKGDAAMLPNILMPILSPSALSRCTSNLTPPPATMAFPTTPLPMSISLPRHLDSPVHGSSGSTAASAVASSSAPMAISSAPSSPLPSPPSSGSGVSHGHGHSHGGHHHHYTHRMSGRTPIPKLTYPFPPAHVSAMSSNTVSPLPRGASPTPAFSMLRVGGPGAGFSGQAMLAMMGVGDATSVTSTTTSATASPMPLMHTGSTNVGLNLVARRLGSLAAAHMQPSSSRHSPPPSSGTKRSLTAMEGAGTSSSSLSVASPASVSNVSAGSSPAISPTPSSSGFDVLLVEDVRVAQRIAQRALQSSGYRVDAANSGEAAVERFKLHADSLRIVLMDINLPGMSGTDATELIRAWERDVLHITGCPAVPAPSSRSRTRAPVLVFGLTGNTEHDNLRLYEQAGMNGCIAKGTLLGQAVRAAMEAWARAPGTFVHFSASGTSTPLPPPSTPSFSNLASLGLSPASSISTGPSPMPMRLSSTPNGPCSCGSAAECTCQHSQPQHLAPLALPALPSSLALPLDPAAANDRPAAIKRPRLHGPDEPVSSAAGVGTPTTDTSMKTSQV